MIKITQLAKLHIEEGKSLRQICRDLGKPEGNKSYLGRLLREAGYEVRRGKLGFKVGDKVSVFCSICKQERTIISRSVSKPYTKLCRRCATAKSHKDNPRIGRAENHYNWKGGINLNKQGYIVEYVRKDSSYYPMATNTGGKRFGGYILQHRLVMAKHLGRCLHPYELVHHIDGNKQNNVIGNLKLTNHKEHSRAYSDAYQDGYNQAMRDNNKTWDGEKWTN